MQGTQPCNWRVTRGLFQARGFATGISTALVFLLVRVGKKESGQNSPGRVPSSMQVPAARERGSVCCCISGRVRVATLRCRSVLYFFRILKSFVACLHCMKSKTQFRGPSRGRFPSTFFSHRTRHLRHLSFLQHMPPQLAQLSSLQTLILDPSRHRHPPHKEIGAPSKPIHGSFIVSFVYGGMRRWLILEDDRFRF